jgi:Tfp pilus assembly protein PilO
MKQETKRLSSIIIAAIIIVVAVVVYFEFIVPAYTNLEAVKGQEESEQTLYANEQQIVSQGKALLATYQSEASSSQSVSLALPVGEDVAGALAQVYGIATNSDFTIQDIGVSVQAVAPQDDDAGAQIADAATTGSVIKPTGTVSFQVAGTGSYESFKNFLQGLETNIRIFDVSAISLEPAAAGSTKTQGASADIFNYSITVVTYYQAP